MKRAAPSSAEKVVDAFVMPAGVLPGARALGVRPEWAPCLPDFRPGGES